MDSLLSSLRVSSEASIDGRWFYTEVSTVALIGSPFLLGVAISRKKVLPEVSNKVYSMKELKQITKEHLLEVVISEGALPSLEYWNKPTVTDLDNTMFSDTVILDFYSTRIKDDKVSGDFSFYLNTDDLSYHYTNSLNERGGGRHRRVGLEALKCLIDNDYIIPHINNKSK